MCAATAVSSKRDIGVQDIGQSEGASFLSSKKRFQLTADRLLDSKRSQKDTKHRSFPSDASIIFVGPRGAGKSSLAVIAGAMLRYQVIDDDKFFLKSTGLSKRSYRKAHGRQAYISCELAVMKAMLSEHQRSCVIACGQGAITPNGTLMLRGYLDSNPVIYVSREIDALSEYLGTDTHSSSHNFLRKLHTAWRASSNFEFFNLCERWKDREVSETEKHLEAVLPYRTFRRRSMQTLQNTKCHLARFLSVLLGKNSSILSDTTFQTLIPPQPEARPFSQSLCIPLSRLQKEEFHFLEIDPGADAVELIADMSEYTEKSLGAQGSLEWAVAILRRRFGVPIILHIKPDFHSSELSAISNEATYFDLLHMCLRLSPEYLMIDLKSGTEEIRNIISLKGNTKIIGKIHMNEPVSKLWRSSAPHQQYERGRELGCDIISISKPCLTVEDNFDCQQFRSDINSASENIPVVAFNTGPLGLLSRTFNPFLTPITHSSLLASPPSSSDKTRPLECASTLRRTLFSLNVMQPLQFYVFGAEVESSLSPTMHNAGFVAAGMPHSHRFWQTKTLQSVKSAIVSENFGGASISMPFKTEVASMVQELSPAAALIGAANTLLPIRENSSVQMNGLDKRSKHQRNQSGPVTSLFGDNTDWMGIYACIVRYTSPANSVTGRTTALVLGAGGMSRACIYTLVKLGLRNIFIFNRTVDKARSLADEYKRANWTCRALEHTGSERANERDAVDLSIKVIESIDDKWPPGFDHPSIIVSTVPTHRKTDSPAVDLRLPDEWLQHHTGGVIVELAYHSRETPLAAQFRERKQPRWTLIDPVEVLFEQACSQFELFTGCKAPREAMWEACLAKYTEQVELQNTSLVET